MDFTYTPPIRCLKATNNTFGRSIDWIFSLDVTTNKLTHWIIKVMTTRGLKYHVVLEKCASNVNSSFKNVASHHKLRHRGWKLYREVVTEINSDRVNFGELLEAICFLT